MNVPLLFLPLLRKGRNFILFALEKFKWINSIKDTLLLYISLYFVLRVIRTKYTDSMAMKTYTIALPYWIYTHFRVVSFNIINVSNCLSLKQRQNFSLKSLCKTLLLVGLSFFKLDSSKCSRTIVLDQNLIFILSVIKSSNKSNNQWNIDDFIIILSFYVTKLIYLTEISVSTLKSLIGWGNISLLQSF